MGRPSKVEQHNLGPLIHELQAEGVTEWRALANTINARLPGTNISRDAVRRWVEGKVGQAAKARKAKTNGAAAGGTVIASAKPIEPEADWLTRVLQNYMGIAECTDVPIDTRMRALEQAGYFAVFKETGAPP